MAGKKGLKEGGRLAVILLAAFLYAATIKLSIKAGGLYPSGIAGLTILLQTILRRYAGINVLYSVLNITLNIIPAYIGYRFVGKKFAMYSILVMVLSSILVDVIPMYHITDDLLLLSVFGGIVNGAVASLAYAMEATSGGFDFIYIFLSQKRGIDSFNIILGWNVGILTTAGFLFGWEKALYSIFFQFATSQMIHLLHRSYQQVSLFVITSKPKEVADAIHHISHHGATVIQAKGSHLGTEEPLVYSVIDAPNTKKVVSIIREIDEKSFINTIQTKEVKGDFYQKPYD